MIDDRFQNLWVIGILRYKINACMRCRPVTITTTTTTTTSTNTTMTSTLYGFVPPYLRSVLDERKLAIPP